MVGNRCLPPVEHRGNAIERLAGHSKRGDASMTAAPIEIPRAARGVVDDLANATAVPVKALISGGIGTGKTTLLAAARDILRRVGLTVLTRPPRDDDPAEAALVVDDAHLFDRFRTVPTRRTRPRCPRDRRRRRRSSRAAPSAAVPGDGHRTGATADIAGYAAGRRAPTRLHRRSAVPGSCGGRGRPVAGRGGQPGASSNDCAGSTNPPWTPCSSCRWPKNWVPPMSLPHWGFR